METQNIQFRNTVLVNAGFTRERISPNIIRSLGTRTQKFSPALL